MYEVDIGCKLAEVKYEIMKGEFVKLKKESKKGNVVCIFEYGIDGEVKLCEEIVKYICFELTIVFINLDYGKHCSY